MLEKLGLPAKPSLRGNNWVVDASHCQGCSSQFTFLNRKHHCRRCGGIFCSSCTQQRILLRGQGDSPVRVCDPCKKQEEAVRYEMRHGHKSRAGKATSKVASRGADEVLNEIFGGDGSRGSSSNDPMKGGENDVLKVLDDDEVSKVHDELSSSSPEELRQQSLEEKNKYKTLKGEGKSSEALKAFKRAKELERQAAAMDLQLRKNRKRALVSSSSSASMDQSQKLGDSPPELSEKGKQSVRKGKNKDDINDELKALGWSETDIHEVERKPAPTSVESELISLMGEASGKTGQKKGAGGVDKTEVVVLKKKALMLKREGKLAEAKEELKKAKILEKQLEEQELLGDDDESDDELSALIRSMGDDKHDNLSMGHQLDSGINFDNLDGDDIGIGSALEVTDDDMYDPDLYATLKSLGWTEEPVQPVEVISPKVPVDKDRLEQEVISLKKEALSQKRAGNVAEAMSLLKKAKLLEKDLQGLESYNLAPPEKESELDTVESRSLVSRANLEPKQAPKSRLALQKELLALNKKALALRREGKVGEAAEELEKGKILEQQLKDLDNAPKMKAASPESAHEISQLSSQHIDIFTDLPSDVDEGEADLTEQDMHDPTYLSLLQNMGWQEEDSEATVPPSKSSEKDDAPILQSSHEVGDKRTKAEIQKELLGLKRKAFALRRQGQTSEAEEVLELAHALESKLEEMEPIVKEEPAELAEHVPQAVMTKDEDAKPHTERPSEVKDAPLDAEATSSEKSSIDPQSSPQQVILGHKRRALALKREGKLTEARDELRKAKLLEKALEEEKSEGSPSPSTIEVSTPSPAPSVSFIAHEELSPPNPAPKPMSSHERFKLQRECLNHKRNALKLRREGRIEEADSELQIANTLEAQLEEASGRSPGESSKEEGTAADLGMEGLLDPQILAALKAIGMQDVSNTSQAPSKTQPVKPPVSAPEKAGSSNQERIQLEAEIKAEKVKALNFKRSGKQAEALDALRKSKQLEKKLNALSS